MLDAVNFAYDPFTTSYSLRGGQITQLDPIRSDPIWYEYLEFESDANWRSNQIQLLFLNPHELYLDLIKLDPIWQSDQITKKKKNHKKTWNLKT